MVSALTTIFDAHFQGSFNRISLRSDCHCPAQISIRRSRFWSHSCAGPSICNGARLGAVIPSHELGCRRSSLFFPSALPPLLCSRHFHFLSPSPLMFASLLSGCLFCFAGFISFCSVLCFFSPCFCAFSPSRWSCLPRLRVQFTEKFQPPAIGMWS